MSNVEIGTSKLSVILLVEIELLEDRNRIKKFITYFRSLISEEKLTLKTQPKDCNLSNNIDGSKIITKLAPNKLYKECFLEFNYLPLN